MSCPRSALPLCLRRTLDACLTGAHAVYPQFLQGVLAVRIRILGPLLASLGDLCRGLPSVPHAGLGESCVVRCGCSYRMRAGVGGSRGVADQNRHSVTQPRNRPDCISPVRRTSKQVENVDSSSSAGVQTTDAADVAGVPRVVASVDVLHVAC